MPPLLRELIAEIDVFLAGSGMSESKFGVDAMSDKHFVRDLRGGRDCKASTVERCREFIAAHWVDSGGSGLAQQPSKALDG